MVTTKVCPVCSKQFRANRGVQKWCSKYCSNRDPAKTQYTCEVCGVVKKTTKRNLTTKKTLVCLDCQKGEHHPNWRGGWKYWQEGKRASDPQGLSWNAQQKLAWERDNYTCQDCGFTQPDWKPAVHHIKPYRLSQSHALDNLICLCPPCHVKADNAMKDYGKPLKPMAPKHSPCRDCGTTRRKLNKRGYCQPCSPKHTDEPTRPKTEIKYCQFCQRRIRESLGGTCSICIRDQEIKLVCDLLNQGVAPETIEQEWGLSHSTVYRHRTRGIKLGLLPQPTENTRKRYTKI